MRSAIGCDVKALNYATCASSFVKLSYHKLAPAPEPVHQQPKNILEQHPVCAETIEGGEASSMR